MPTVQITDFCLIPLRLMEQERGTETVSFSDKATLELVVESFQKWQEAANVEPYMIGNTYHLRYRQSTQIYLISLYSNLFITPTDKSTWPKVQSWTKRQTELPNWARHQLICLVRMVTWQNGCLSSIDESWRGFTLVILVQVQQSIAICTFTFGLETALDFQGTNQLTLMSLCLLK